MLYLCTYQCRNTVNLDLHVWKEEGSVLVKTNNFIIDIQLLYNYLIAIRPDLFRYCKELNKSGRILCTASKRTYAAKHNVTCKSSNLIYCITCTQCGIQYVGQTKNRLMDRFQAHFYSISAKKTNTEIGKHFNSVNHQGLQNVEILYTLWILSMHTLQEKNPDF